MAPITAYIGAMAGVQAAHSKHLSTSPLKVSRSTGVPTALKVNRGHKNGHIHMAHKLMLSQPFSPAKMPAISAVFVFVNTLRLYIGVYGNHRAQRVIKVQFSDSDLDGPH